MRERVKATIFGSRILERESNKREGVRERGKERQKDRERTTD